MPIETINILREVQEIWNMPSAGRLDPRALVNALNRCYNQRKIELSLSGGSYLVELSPVFTIGITRRVNLGSIGIAEQIGQTRVEMRILTSTLESEWQELNRGAFSDWTSYERSNRYYCAFFGNPDTPDMIVNFDPANYSFRIWFEPFQPTDQSAPLINMSDVFRPLMVYDTAIEASLLIDDRSAEFSAIRNSKLQTLAVRQMDALKLFKKWLASRNSQTVETRQRFNERENDKFPGFPNHGITLRW